MTNELPPGSTILISHAVMAKMRAEAAAGKKIAIIKLLRAEYMRREGFKLHLVSAKGAAERWLAELDGEYSTDDPRPKIRIHLALKSLTVDFGAGDIVVDLDELQLRALSGVTSIGFEEAGRMLDLVTMLQYWEHGYSVGVYLGKDGDGGGRFPGGGDDDPDSGSGMELSVDEDSESDSDFDWI